MGRFQTKKGPEKNVSSLIRQTTIMIVFSILKSNSGFNWDVRANFNLSGDFVHLHVEFPDMALLKRLHQSVIQNLSDFNQS